MQTVADVSWQEFKATVAAHKLGVRFMEFEDVYRIFGLDGMFSIECALLKTDTENVADFENNHKDLWKKPIKREVQTQSEVDDKVLKTVQANGKTDAEGRLLLRFPIPVPHRWIAYGDAEFKVRHFFDRIEKIEVVDTKREIAWAIALGMYPGSQAPLPDEAIQAMSREEIEGAFGVSMPEAPFTQYPSIGGFQDEEFPTGEPIEDGGAPAHCAGMAMTYQYGTTEAQPVGGYAKMPGVLVPILPTELLGGLELQITLFKGEDCPTDERKGQYGKCSVDWAKSKV